MVREEQIEQAKSQLFLPIGDNGRNYEQSLSVNDKKHIIEQYISSEPKPRLLIIDYVECLKYKKVQNLGVAIAEMNALI
jgi:hypothetical protein